MGNLKSWILLLIVYFLLCAISSRAQSEITLTSNNTGCTTLNPCTLQVYREICNVPNGMGVMQCPDYPNSGFILLMNTQSSLSTSSTAQSTNWIFHDKNGDSSRPNMSIGQLYGYVQTAIYNGDPKQQPSFPSNLLAIPFQLSGQNTPPFPVTGDCRIVR